MLRRKHQAARLGKAWEAWQASSREHAYKQDLAGVMYSRTQMPRLQRALQTWARMSHDRKACHDRLLHLAINMLSACLQLLWTLGHL